MKVGLVIMVIMMAFLMGMHDPLLALESGSKAKSIAGSTAAGQSSAGTTESIETGSIGDEITAYKGKDEIREEDVIPAYPDLIPEDKETDREHSEA